MTRKNAGSHKYLLIVFSCQLLSLLLNSSVSFASGPLAAGRGALEGAQPTVAFGFDRGGRVDSVSFRPGQKVVQGEILAKLECSVESARADAAAAAVDAALSRLKMVKDGEREELTAVAAARVKVAGALVDRRRLKSSRLSNLQLRGQLVSPGDVDDALGALRQAEATLAAEQAALLLSSAPGRTDEIDAAIAEVRQLEHERASLDAEVSRCVLKAPANGTVVRRNVEPGEVLLPLEFRPVGYLSDLSQWRVRIELDEDDAGKIVLGQRVEVFGLSLGADVLQGKVVEIDTMLIPRQTRTALANEKLDRKVRIARVALDACSNRCVLGLEVDFRLLP